MKILIENRLINLEIINKRLTSIIDVKYDNDEIEINYRNNQIKYRIGDNIKIKIYLLKDDIKMFKIILDNKLLDIEL